MLGRSKHRPRGVPSGPATRRKRNFSGLGPSAQPVWGVVRDFTRGRVRCAREFLVSAQGTAARRHSAKELVCPSGGALDPGPVVRVSLLRCLLLLALAAGHLAGQLPLSPRQERAFSAELDQSEAAGEPLHCRVETFKPFLDFSFRYEAGYLVECPIAQFDGNKAEISTFLQVRSSGGTVTRLGQGFAVPAMPPAMRDKVNLRHVHSDLGFSGVFAVGEGEYEIELTVFDDRHRSHQKHWHAKASPHGREMQAANAMKPGSVAAISVPPWEGTSSEGKGLRLTVLLDAAPMYPFSKSLRAWDRAFLLGSLSSLLRGLPLQSVRLVAFNLDQQKELYHDDNFDRTGFYRLNQALSKLELGTISYKTLARENGWAELLAKLVQSESTAKQPVDAVVFIGPTNRIKEKAPDYLRETAGKTDLPFFYFEYYPAPGHEYPDTIQHWTDDLNGTIYKLYSPGDLALAITKMQKELRKSGASIQLTQ